MAVVSFSYPLFAARFPQYASLDPNYLQALWNEAGLYVSNSDCSPICDDSVGGMRQMILNLTLAHLVAMNATINGQAPSNLVGRISNASQGSVSVGATLDYPPGSAQWWASTPAGAAAWTALAPYRTAIYFPVAPRNMNPFGFAGYYGNGFGYYG